MARRAGLLGLLLALGITPTAAADPSPRPTLSLEQALELAKSRSPELAGLKERAIEAEANVQKAWALLKPQWNLTYNWTHLEPGPPALEFPEPLNFADPGIQANCADGGDPMACIDALVSEFNRVRAAPPRRLDFANQNTHTVGTRVSWTILDGRTWPLLFDAQDNVALETSRADARRRELLLLVAKAYYSAAATQAAIAATERARARAQSQQAITESRAEVGDRAKPLLEAARVAVRQAENDVARAKNAHEQSLLALSLLLGGDGRWEVSPPSAPLARPPETGQALRDASLARRPDLTAALVAVEIAERGRDDYWWSFVPSVSLFAGWRYSNVQGLTGQNDQWSFGVNASLPLYDGGARYAEADLADSRLHTARLAVDGVKQRLLAELERSELRLEAAELVKARALETLSLAQQNLEIVKAQREVGAVRPLELQEATDAVLDAELGVIRADVEIAIGTLELLQAAGLFEP